MFGVPMSMIVWILLGFALGLIASKIVTTTGEGTVVDILLGIVGAVVAGWIYDLFGGTGVTGFNIESVYSRGRRNRRDYHSGAISRLFPPPHALTFSAAGVGGHRLKPADELQPVRRRAIAQFCQDRG
jgi:uncharacterized membrane protein YeaQ/YmgE (transglycosylase-associated protein family)